MPKESTIQAQLHHSTEIQERAAELLAKRFPGQVVPGCQVIRYRAAGNVYVKIWYGQEYVEVEQHEFFATVRRLSSALIYRQVFSTLKECPTAITN